MVITPEQQAFLQSLSQSGVQLSVTHWAIGEILIAPDKIQAFVQDEDQFAADYHKVSKEQLVAWGCFINNQLCLGTTKLGKQCANRADEPESVLWPHQFDRSNLNCYCHLHKPI